MTNLDVKQRICSLQQLPVLPHIARELLSSLDSGTVHWAELASISENDEALSRQIKAEALAKCQSPAAAPLEAHLMALGLPHVMQLTFERLAPTLFDGPRSSGLDMKAFWAHAFAVAQYAARIARKVGSRYEPLAYAAGLFHDIGKPALDRVAPGGYTRALELVRQQGLFALEAERRELGADHTVAGKWLAEAWGVPSPIIFAIWLHHHPPGTLDNTPYPIELIEIVSLANFLAHGDALESPPQERIASLDERRYLRLGLERVDVLEMLRDGTRAPAPVAPAGEVAEEKRTPDASRTEAARTRYERNFYEALCTLHERLQPGMASAAQLTLFVDGLRKAFSIPVGLCYLTDDGRDTPVVLRWRSQEEEPESVSGPQEDGGRSTPLDELIATLETEGGTGSASGVLQRHGFVALPLLDGNRSVGQLIFQGGTGGPHLTETFLNDLMRFVKGAGTALARCRAVRGVHEEAESLAAAVWKQEISHRHDRRTERLISVGKMAAGAAHEINNPLAVISGKAQMLLANTERPEDRKALETIVEHSQRASGILRDLLQFARPNPPQLLPSRISYVVKTSVDRVRQKFADEGIQLVEDYAQDLPQIHVDRVQLDQVFQNLLKNAVQAMTRQGDKLTVRVRPNQDRTAVLVQIIDTGQGIAADIMDKVFEPFFTTQSGAEGTGMGLAVCHGIVEAHRGTITLHSQEGAGTTCTVTLPIAADRGTDLASEAAVTEPPIAPDARAAAPARRAPAIAPEVAAAMGMNLSGTEYAPATPPAYAPAAKREEAARNRMERASAEGAATGRPIAERNATERGANILLVDNDPALTDVLAEALRNRGYAIRTATDGLEALAEVIANPIDLVILDGAIPGVNTPLALADEVQKRNPELSVVLLLGPTATLEVGPPIGNGSREVLRKPFNVAQLFQTIETALARRHVA